MHKQAHAKLCILEKVKRKVKKCLHATSVRAILKAQREMIKHAERTQQQACGGVHNPQHKK
jgi:hypothetical protein